MKKTTILFAACTIAAFTISCDKVQEAQNAANAAETVSEAAENIQESLNEGQKVREARKQRGDTLAMPTATLQTYLPQVTGYQPQGDVQMSSQKAPGISLSTVSQTFLKGENYVKVTIADYNGSYDMMDTQLSVFGTDYQFEDNNTLARGIDLGLANAKGWEQLQKTDKISTLTLAVAYRFLVVIEANGQSDFSYVENLAKQMKLDELAQK